MGGHYKEGTIKFQVEHQVAVLDPVVYGRVAQSLISWRDRLLRAGLVGRDPNRYGGVCFGNLSGRLPPFPGSPGRRPFLITGTQTGGLLSLTLAELCVITRYCPECNLVGSLGLTRPSSESMTHGVVYDANPAIHYVFHGHSPAIWEQARILGTPIIDPVAGYGTPAMCWEVQRLLRDRNVARGRILVMGGHQDGILAFGENAEEAGRALLDLLSQALSLGRP
ncbi:MAG: class II aldolase/adducin family protein [Candidatus Binatia bacterium]